MDTGILPYFNEEGKGIANNEALKFELAEMLESAGDREGEEEEKYLELSNPL